MILTKTLAWLISPYAISLLLIAFGVLLLVLGRRRRLALGLVAAGWVWMVGWSLPPVGTAMRLELESAYPLQPVEALPAAPAVVVLGGAMRVPDRRYPLPGLTDTSDRVWQAARLYRAGKAPLLLLSGGSDPSVNTMSEARAMQWLLRELGIPDAAMVLEERSRTTRQNAEFSAALLRERGIARVLLVTSATHMHRARAEFEAVGLQVTPVAIGQETGLTPDWGLPLPEAGALSASGRMVKEFVGRWVAGWR